MTRNSVPRSFADPSAKNSPRRFAAKGSTSGTPTARSISISPARLRSTSSDTACPKSPPPWPSRRRNSSSFTPASSPRQSPKSTREELLAFAGDNFRGGAVYFTCGGSESIETALKLARQYQVEIGQPAPLPDSQPPAELSRLNARSAVGFRQQAPP